MAKWIDFQEISKYLNDFEASPNRNESKSSDDKIHLMFFLPYLQSGGTPKFVLNLATVFIENNYRVSIVTFERPGTKPFPELPDGINLFCIGHNPNVRVQRGNAQIKWNAVLDTTEIARKQCADILIPFTTFHTSPVALAGVALGIPVLFCDRAIWGDNGQNRWYAERELLEKYSTNIVIQTEAAFQELLSRNVSSSKISVIPNGINLQNQLQTEPSNKESSHRKKILCVSRLSFGKNIPLLIEAFHPIATQHHNWDLHLLGEGSDRLLIEQLVFQLNLGDRVFIHGAVKNVDTYYSSSSIFAFPSMLEGFPNALLEAISFGLPVVAFDDFGGSDELLIDQVNGIKLSRKKNHVENVSELTKALHALIKHKNKRRLYSENSTKISKKFDQLLIKESWIKLVEKKTEKSIAKLFLLVFDNAIACSDTATCFRYNNVENERNSIFFQDLSQSDLSLQFWPQLIKLCKQTFGNTIVCTSTEVISNTHLSKFLNQVTKDPTMELKIVRVETPLEESIPLQWAAKVTQAQTDQLPPLSQYCINSIEDYESLEGPKNDILAPVGIHITNNLFYSPLTQPTSEFYDQLISEILGTAVMGDTKKSSDYENKINWFSIELTYRLSQIIKVDLNPPLYGVVQKFVGEDFQHFSVPFEKEIIARLKQNEFDFDNSTAKSFEFSDLQKTLLNILTKLLANTFAGVQHNAHLNAELSQCKALLFQEKTKLNKNITTIKNMQKALNTAKKNNLETSERMADIIAKGSVKDLAVLQLKAEKEKLLVRAWNTIRKKKSSIGLQFQIFRDKQIIKRSKKFDSEFYSTTYFPDAAQDADHLRHYVSFGVTLGYEPTRSFNTREYLYKHPEVAFSGENPFVHFLRHENNHD